ncbi:ZapG family protein [Algicola sagamiensis]|uniref:ZapG family protein n=1 Tax=Algicola sagamiensis TaxID=163869 RepID=UPI000382AB98|nr:DUF1043 family protein [Algicola sagamiensis]
MIEALYFLAGTLIGVVITAIYYARFHQQAQQQTQLKEQFEQTQNELHGYRSDVEKHLQETTDLIKELQGNFIEVTKRIEETKQRLASPPKVEDVSMFSQEADELLKTQLSKKDAPRQSRPKPETQPIDYSANGDNESKDEQSDLKVEKETELS